MKDSSWKLFQLPLWWSTCLDFPLLFIGFFPRILFSVFFNVFNRTKQNSLFFLFTLLILNLWLLQFSFSVLVCLWDFLPFFLIWWVDHYFPSSLLFDPVLWTANHFCLHRASLATQMVKNLPATQETRVWSLGREDPLEKEMATHSSILA